MQPSVLACVWVQLDELSWTRPAPHTQKKDILFTDESVQTVNRMLEWLKMEGKCILCYLGLKMSLQLIKFTDNSQKYQIYSHNLFKSSPDWQIAQMSQHHFLAKCSCQKIIVKMMGRKSCPRDSCGEVIPCKPVPAFTALGVLCCLASFLHRVTPLLSSDSSSKLSLKSRTWSTSGTNNMSSMGFSELTHASSEVFRWSAEIWWTIHQNPAKNPIFLSTKLCTGTASSCCRENHYCN